MFQGFPGGNPIQRIQGEFRLQDGFLRIHEFF